MIDPATTRYCNMILHSSQHLNVHLSDVHWHITCTTFPMVTPDGRYDASVVIASYMRLSTPNNQERHQQTRASAAGAPVNHGDAAQMSSSA